MIEEQTVIKPKKRKGVLITILVILLPVVSFFGGFLAKGMMKEDKKEKNIEEKDNKEEKKEEIPVTDKFIVNLYTDSVGVYVVDNGELYYLKAEEMEDGRFFLLTHSGCLSDGTSSYCKGNPIYSKKAVKIEGLTNVKRVKLFTGYKSDGENFQVYAITEDGNVYEINSNKKGEIAYTDVVDMVGDKDNKIVLKRKDGTQKTISNEFYSDVLEF